MGIHMTRPMGEKFCQNCRKCKASYVKVVKGRNQYRCNDCVSKTPEWTKRKRSAIAELNLQPVIISAE